MYNDFPIFPNMLLFFHTIISRALSSVPKGAKKALVFQNSMNTFSWLCVDYCIFLNEASVRRRSWLPP